MGMMSKILWSRDINAEWLESGVRSHLIFFLMNFTLNINLSTMISKKRRSFLALHSWNKLYFQKLGFRVDCINDYHIFCCFITIFNCRFYSVFLITLEWVENSRHSCIAVFVTDKNDLDIQRCTQHCLIFKQNPLPLSYRRHLHLLL